MAWSAIWTDPAELREASIDHAHDLREAINERYDIANALEDPAVTLTKPAMCTDNGTLHLWTKATIRDQVAAALAALCPSFVDTTASVTGAVQVRRWSSVSDIITNGLSETVIAKPAPLDADDFAWWSQQKRALDLMKWSRHNIAPSHFSIEGRVGAGASFAAAVTAFNSASWSAGGSYTQHFTVETAGTWTVHRERAQIKTASAGFDYPTISNEWEVSPSTRQPKKTYDYISFFLAAADAYENNDYTTGGDSTFGVVYANGTANTDQNFITVTGGYVLPEADGTTPYKEGGIDAVSGTNPGAGNSQGWGGVSAISTYILYKWDVTGGLNKVT